MPTPSSRFTVSPLVLLLLPGLASLASAALSLAPLGRYSSGSFSTGGNNPTAAEIAAYDPVSKRAFVVNSVPDASGTTHIDVLDLSNPAAPVKVAAIPFGSTASPLNPNSVTLRNGVLAVALGRGVAAGEVNFFDAAAATGVLNGGTPLAAVNVGSIPDMLTFTPDGTKLLVANEAEPSGYGVGHTDPEGSISIINVSFPGQGQVTVGANVTAGFTAFNVQEAALKTAGVRIFGPGATVAQDLEPEYIAISADSTKAYVTLQENNAIATVDIATGTVTNITPLGKKDHSIAGNGFDGSRTDGINIAQRPVSSFYAPDAITSFQANGKTYLFTANEGDYRDYAGYVEETTVGNAGVVLDPAVFPNAAVLKGTAGPDGIRTLTITTANGQFNPDGTGDADYEEIIMVGSRSFSTWEANADGTVSLRYDSGDDLEQISASLYSSNFNVTNDQNTTDRRSNAKGPEPESVTTGMVGATPILFVGNERQSNILMFDITNPELPVFLSSISLRDFNTNPGPNAGGDIGPEGMLFVPASESPNGEPLLIVTFENSGTTTIFKVTDAQFIPEASSCFLTIGAALPLLLRRRR